jgi:hypothetical protein
MVVTVDEVLPRPQSSGRQTMVILVLVGSAGLFGGVLLWARRGSQLLYLDTDATIPDHVPVEWVRAYGSDQR